MDYFYEYTKYEELSTRSKNLVQDIGGMDEVAMFYKKHGNFLSFRNSGRKTNRELCSISQYIIANEKLYFSKPLVGKYLIIKSSLSVRAANVLSSLEEVYNVYKDEEGWKQLINRVLSGEIEFLDFKNCGDLTKVELNDILCKELRQFASYMVVNNESLEQD
jgi:hypothetical protein